MPFFYEIRSTTDTVLKRTGSFPDREAAKFTAWDEVKRLKAEHKHPAGRYTCRPMHSSELRAGRTRRYTGSDEKGLGYREERAKLAKGCGKKGAVFPARAQLRSEVTVRRLKNARKFLKIGEQACKPDSVGEKQKCRTPRRSFL